MKAILAIVGLASAAIGFSAVAAERALTTTIKAVYPLSSGGFVLVFNNESSYCTSGSSPKYYYVSPGENGVTADGAKMLFAASLAAASQRATITMTFDDATSNCYINRILVNY